MTTAEMPNHSHGGATGQGYGWPYSNAIYANGSQGGTFQPATWAGALVGYDATYMNRTLHTHPITAEGGNGSHNNMQPTIAALLVIKT